MSIVHGQRGQFGGGRIERRSLEIGHVVRQTFDALGRNIGPFLILALLLTGVPALLFGLWQTSSTLGMIGHPAPAIAIRSGLISIVGGLVSLALMGVFQAAVVYGVVNDLNGARNTIGELVSTGLRFALPAVAISLIFGIVMGLGFVLLIVPGLMIATAWIVALPAEVVERTGIMAAFSRSGELVKGARWRILALLAIYFVAAMIVALAIFALTAALVHRGAPVTSVAQRLPILIVQVVLNAGLHMVAATGVAVIYQDLRAAREGVAPADLAAVFD
jgi:hypothetical protein